MVDVPGHERFVRTMVAGASGIDLFLLCVAADDGVMPQTREHLAVLRGLGVDAGRGGDHEGRPGRARAGGGGGGRAGAGRRDRAGLRAQPARGWTSCRPRSTARPGGCRAATDRRGPPRLHVDRSFTLRGIGTVVTGTLWSGSIGQGDTVRVLPRGLEARVRSVQVHDQPVERAEAGQRVALNLVGVGWRELGRGDVVSPGDAELEPTYLLDVAVTLEPGARPLRARRARARPPRHARGAGAGRRSRATSWAGHGFAQLRLEAPLVPAAGDRVILRQLAPPDTWAAAW